MIFFKTKRLDPDRFRREYRESNDNRKRFWTTFFSSQSSLNAIITKYQYFNIETDRYLIFDINLPTWIYNFFLQ